MCDGNISTDCELVLKAQYMNCMQDNMKGYWEQNTQQNNIIVNTLTIVHPCLDITTITEVRKKQKSVCNKNKSRKAIQRVIIICQNMIMIPYLIKSK